MNIKKKPAFISKENRSPINKNSRKHKHRLFYQWKLERFRLENELHSGLDIFPSSPANKGIQLIKEQLIAQLNTENIFDFEFQAQKKDVLSIRNTKDSTDYLNLIFLNGLWVEEVYLFSLRKVVDDYEMLRNGEVELKSN